MKKAAKKRENSRQQHMVRPKSFFLIFSNRKKTMEKNPIETREDNVFSKQFFFFFSKKEREKREKRMFFQRP